MKFAVFADIHGNYVALEKCVNYVLEKGIVNFIFLGDYIGELAYPQRAMQMIYDIKEKYNCTFVRGNKEDYWLDYRGTEESNRFWKDNDSTTGMLLYAYNNLTEADINFFEKMSIASKLKFDGCMPFTICHGSPYRTNEKMIIGSDRTKEILENSDVELIIYGHTHRQGKTEHKSRVVLNPGSLGVPLGSDGKAQFLILESTESGWQEEFVSLEYDVDAVIADMEADNLFFHAPSWSKSTERLLSNGRVSNGAVLGRAMELCKQETGECNWPDIPEKYWEKALIETEKKLIF